MGILGRGGKTTPGDPVLVGIEVWWHLTVFVKCVLTSIAVPMRLPVTDLSDPKRIPLQEYVR